MTEAQTKFQADYMAENLLAHGWELITVEIQWYGPDPGLLGWLNISIISPPSG